MSPWFEAFPIELEPATSGKGRGEEEEEKRRERKEGDIRPLQSLGPPAALPLLFHAPSPGSV